ncbi:MAG: hypothetical protein ACLU70_09410 [Lachnospira sp.]
MQIMCRYICREQKEIHGEFVMPNPYAIDITEIDGFDNMHHTEDILKEAFERTAKLFGAEESLWLINGSSAGLLAAICGATKKK